MIFHFTGISFYPISQQETWKPSLTVYLYFLDDSNKLNFMNKKLLIKDLSELKQLNTKNLKNYLSLISEQTKL